VGDARPNEWRTLLEEKREGSKGTDLIARGEEEGTTRGTGCVEKKGGTGEGEPPGTKKRIVLPRTRAEEKDSSIRQPAEVEKKKGGRSVSVIAGRCTNPQRKKSP